MITVWSSVTLFCFCLVAVYTLDEESNSKTKRDVSGLFPFPRVGRGRNLWNSQTEGYQEIKRQGLIPFPRVGRSGTRLIGGKRDTTQNNGGGMWFGPRLGRVQKREIDNTGTWALVQLREFPFIGAKAILKENFTPRLGRDSNEEYQNAPEYQHRGQQLDPNNFTPRLGREQTLENLPDNI